MTAVLQLSLLRTIFLNYITFIYLQDNDFYIFLKNSKSLLAVALFLQNSSWFQCKQLLDIVCVDYPTRKNRFEITYVLLSLRFNVRIFLKVSLSEIDALPSLSSKFKSANWLEREVWDLYGVFFENHPDLRRILTDYGFQGFPLRKDFPLTGFTEVRYDDNDKRVIQERLELTQEFRFFQTLMAWDKILK